MLVQWGFSLQICLYVLLFLLWCRLLVFWVLLCFDLVHSQQLKMAWILKWVVTMLLHAISKLGWGCSYPYSHSFAKLLWNGPDAGSYFKSRLFSCESVRSTLNWATTLNAVCCNRSNALDYFFPAISCMNILNTYFLEHQGSVQYCFFIKNGHPFMLLLLKNEGNLY